MKRITIIGLLVLAFIAVAAPSADARVPRLSYGEALDAADSAALDAYLDTDWADDFGATGCYRLSRSRFACDGYISGDLFTFDCNYSYTSCWSTEHYCDVNIRVRSGYYYNWYSKWLSGCTATRYYD
jgi:hypothetical protein